MPPKKHHALAFMPISCEGMHDEDRSFRLDGVPGNVLHLPHPLTPAHLHRRRCARPAGCRIGRLPKGASAQGASPVLLLRRRLLVRLVVRLVGVATQPAGIASP